MIVPEACHSGRHEVANPERRWLRPAGLPDHPARNWVCCGGLPYPTS
jgi:hypothetical protein